MGELGIEIIPWAEIYKETALWKTKRWLKAVQGKKVVHNFE